MDTRLQICSIVSYVLKLRVEIKVRCFFEEYQRMITEVDEAYGDTCHYDEANLRVSGHLNMQRVQDALDACAPFKNRFLDLGQDAGGG